MRNGTHGTHGEDLRSKQTNQPRSLVDRLVLRRLGCGAAWVLLVQRYPAGARYPAGGRTSPSRRDHEFCDSNDSASVQECPHTQLGEAADAGVQEWGVGETHHARRRRGFTCADRSNGCSDSSNLPSGNGASCTTANSPIHTKPIVLYVRLLGCTARNALP